MEEDKPDYRRLIVPALELLKLTENYILFDEIAEALVDGLGLDIEQSGTMLPSGRQTVFENHLQWALSYLEQDRLIESNGVNAFRVTNIGMELSLDRDNLLFGDNGADESTGVGSGQLIPRPGSTGFHYTYGGLEEDSEPINLLPELLEKVSVDFETHTQDLKANLLKHICRQKPAFFEMLIIDLLISMGYAYAKQDLILPLGRSGDRGIDGAIRQDPLGLDVVYVQAKRYRPGLAVPVAAIRDFAGALEAHKAIKGVFVTTSRFTKSGYEFIEAVSSRIILIDGEKLAGLLIQNNIGIKTQETFEIKEINADYFQ